MIVYVLLGLLVGQVVVWLADRLPGRIPVLSTSACPTCGASLLGPAAGRLSAALGWTRCGAEGRRLRWRSLIVIALTAAGFGFLWSRYDDWRSLIPLTFFWAVFVLVAVIDLEHRIIINDVVLLPAMLLALVAAAIRPAPEMWQSIVRALDIPLLSAIPGVIHALLGGMVGFGFMYVVFLLSKPFARVMARRRGKSIDEVPFGSGDVTLSIFIGLVTGFPGVIFALVIGIIVGVAGALGYLFWEALVRKRYVSFTAIPYGPFLIAGGLIMMVYGEQIISAYLRPYM
jgi:leader peptidase (prepilin peptidase) / N-methyltransferase